MIEVNIEQQQNTLILQVINDAPAATLETNDKELVSGVGLKNIAHRLSLIYGDKATFSSALKQVNSDNAIVTQYKYYAKIIIPLGVSND